MNPDPQVILAELRTAASEYLASLQHVVSHAESQVAEWRLSNQDVLPLHPFSQIAKTDSAEGFWQVSKQRWMDDAGEVMFPARVGLDKLQRPVISGSPHRNAQSVVLWNSAFVDDFQVDRKNNGNWEPGRGKSLRLRRTRLDAAGRIAGSATLNEDSLRVEMFSWDAERINSSVESTWEVTGDGTLDRQPPFSRERHYLYDQAGQLQQVMEHNHVIFHSGRGDTLESVTAESVAEHSAAIVARILRLHEEEPDPSDRVARLVLVYSAEHAHCGLPSDVRFAREADEHSDLFYAEELPVVPDWIPKDKVHTFESLLIRLYQLVDSPEVFLEGDAVLPFRQMLWRLARRVREELCKHSEVVADTFIVYPVDDHGDIDPEADFRESVPEELANQWLSKVEDDGVEDEEDEDEDEEEEDEVDEDEDEE